MRRQAERAQKAATKAVGKAARKVVGKARSVDLSKVDLSKVDPRNIDLKNVDLPRFDWERGRFVRKDEARVVGHSFRAEEVSWPLRFVGWVVNRYIRFCEITSTVTVAGDGPFVQLQAAGKPVIVLDAGHGGVDPGALGRKAREKSVTLNFTRELAKQLRKTGKYKVYLTRNRDIYIPLRQRVNIARKHNADLFISIHADAIKRKNVRGMSIYTLSETASDKEAAALAKKENQSDIIAGIDFADQPPEVANILIDLAQRETKNLSVKFANLVVDNARGKTRLLDRTHRFAGFRVLKAPDVPSVLIELGFLTNRSDEKQLLSSAWRRKVAGAMVNSVDGFFRSSRLAALR